MGFIQQLFSQARQTLSNISGVVKNLIARWREHQRLLEQREDYLRWVQEQEIEYRPDKVDVTLARQCKEFLWEIFPDGIASKVEQMTDEEILNLFEQMTKDAASIMGVELQDIDLYSNSKRPQCYYCGYYNWQSQAFHLNAAFLLSHQVELIEEQIYTIFHELKHARQWEAVNGEKDFGYSQETIQRWAENFKYYIPGDENDEAYRKQPVENDAYGFESILKGERQFETLL